LVELGFFHPKVRLAISFIYWCCFFSPSISDAFEEDIERGLQKDLGQSKVLIERINIMHSQGASVTSEFTQLNL
jgi:hypothetical protein